jgi:1-acyl-sn-glycerol-3-phosphate acyltransferase
MQFQSEASRQHNILNWSLQGQLDFDQERMFHRLGPAVISLLARLMLDMDMQWQAPLPAGPKIFAANHPTTVDPFLLLKLAPEDMRILVTGGAFTVPVFGRYLQYVGHIPVIKGRGQQALNEALGQLSSGNSIGIFPEGALSPLAGGLGRPRSGVARLALSSGLPVIPVGIHLQRERIKYVAAKIDGQPSLGRFYLGGPYAMTIGKSLHFEGCLDDWELVNSVAENIMHQIDQLSLESAKRISSSQRAVPAPGAALSREQISLPEAG